MLNKCIFNDWLLCNVSLYMKSLTPHLLVQKGLWSWDFSFIVSQLCLDVCAGQGVAFGVHCGEIDMRCNDHSRRFYNLAVEARGWGGWGRGKTLWAKAYKARVSLLELLSGVEWDCKYLMDLGEIERSSKYSCYRRVVEDGVGKIVSLRLSILSIIQEMLWSCCKLRSTVLIWCGGLGRVIYNGAEELERERLEAGKSVGKYWNGKHKMMRSKQGWESGKGQVKQMPVCSLQGKLSVDLCCREQAWFKLEWEDEEKSLG